MWLVVKRLHRLITGASRREEHDGRGQLSLREERSMRSTG